MRDVEALAGVGLKTVSRVVNDVPTVAPDLVERVRAAADKLGYRPNLTASNLRRGDGRTHTIGLLVENVGNPFSAAVHRAVEDVARRHGLFVLAGSLDEDRDREYDLLRAMIDRRVDGVLLAPAGDDYRHLVTEQQAGTSIVFIYRRPASLVADCVVSDNRGGAAAGVRHLIAHGHRSIAYLGDRSSIATARERYAGYTDALAGAGLAITPHWVRHGLHSVDEARVATLELLTGEHPPEALFTGQNLVTIGAVRALYELGRESTTALVGFDDFLLADVLRPGVTVVAQQPYEIGRLAAERLHARIAGDDSLPQAVVIDTVLIERGSGEIPPSTPVR
ncbi:MAG: LacI family DNA-binding transcriptional regulator [Jatrophihabitans sp.]|uniref:LacI family DNA-binding transcriptional regulator n=1 Tax=Jatrophihabitans sp. TaxID=1932789 RepID=UPI003F8017BF